MLKADSYLSTSLYIARDDLVHVSQAFITFSTGAIDSTAQCYQDIQDWLNAIRISKIDTSSEVATTLDIGEGNREFQHMSFKPSRRFVLEDTI
jgi:hypothetical protein